MILQYFGHSMWKVHAKQLSLVIDPFDNIGYPMPVGLTADAVLISHEHHDHNNAALVVGIPQVFRKSGMYKMGDIRIDLIPVFHDEERGTKRGINHLILIEADGLKLLHCGDLGHLPDKDVLSQIGKLDMLLVPIGEIYTISLTNVLALMAALEPTLVFPMHYKTQSLAFKLGGLDAFLQQAHENVIYAESSLEIDAALLSKKHIVVMKPPV